VSITAGEHPERERAEGEADHGELAEFHADVEGEESHEAAGIRKPHLGEDAGEPEPVEEAEGEHQRDPRGPEARRHGVLDADVDDRERDQGLDEADGRLTTP
jgi:hypothetical protein